MRDGQALRHEKAERMVGQTIWVNASNCDLRDRLKTRWPLA
ncbi:MAG: hypothetical protein AAGH67_18900 [Cyanobacteria bacterium P01_H01_bin.162]